MHEWIHTSYMTLQKGDHDYIKYRPASEQHNNV